MVTGMRNIAVMQSEAYEIALSIHVGPEVEAESEMANAVGCTIVLSDLRLTLRGKFIPSSCEELW